MARESVALLMLSFASAYSFLSSCCLMGSRLLLSLMALEQVSDLSGYCCAAFIIRFKEDQWPD